MGKDEKINLLKQSIEEYDERISLLKQQIEKLEEQKREKILELESLIPKDLVVKIGDLEIKGSKFCKDRCNQCNYLSDETCKHCEDNYLVTADLYKANRYNSEQKVVGYLVLRKKTHVVEGILTKKSCYHEMAYINDTTIEKVD